MRFLPAAAWNTIGPEAALRGAISPLADAGAVTLSSMLRASSPCFELTEWAVEEAMSAAWGRIFQFGPMSTGSTGFSVIRFAQGRSGAGTMAVGTQFLHADVGAAFASLLNARSRGRWHRLDEHRRR